ncbi:hypothetical protein CSC94_05895 [Zhengella mangrovi]|uniref:Uncharacterized protein n=1 Tax=Zhengella mangrovi TaxID=1982044 RepID=A0A2G1QRR0_9HYPH|nr:hypothetical protein [Zhengella mangrovi]PHP68182.1 hypothetical protein CSC94_05895 [Zhengella mangrovi]
MAWVIFTKPFDYDFRPERAACQHFDPAEEPVAVPARVATAAVEDGSARRAKAPTASEKRALKGRPRA